MEEVIQELKNLDDRSLDDEILGMSLDDLKASLEMTWDGFRDLLLMFYVVFHLVD